MAWPRDRRYTTDSRSFGRESRSPSGSFPNPGADRKINFAVNPADVGDDWSIQMSFHGWWAASDCQAHGRSHQPVPSAGLIGSYTPKFIPGDPLLVRLPSQRVSSLPLTTQDLKRGVQSPRERLSIPSCRVHLGTDGGLGCRFMHHDSMHCMRTDHQPPGSLAVVPLQ